MNMPYAEQNMTRLLATKSNPAAYRRRGTVLVFVLGILSLLGLVGLGLIARTHTDAQLVELQNTGEIVDGAMSGTVRTVRERLRDDIFGPSTGVFVPFDRPLSDKFPPFGAAGSVNQFGILENNEPWDKPGVADRWLASILPFYNGDYTINQGTVVESDVLVWDNVSYLGVDILLPPNNGSILGSPFMWGDNARTGSTAIVQYGPLALSNIPILQTPAPGPLAGQPLIPGSTTNITIRQGRDIWDQFHQPALVNAFPGVRPQYPYFDTNRDGVPDLYDADGDGIPDSPISFPIPLDPDDPNSNRTLYAVIRIVDHGGMLNVNTASSLAQTDGSPTFNGALSQLQRRGRSTTEFILDGVTHPDDWFFLGTERVDNLTAYRQSGDPMSLHDPVAHEANVVRRSMLGAPPNGPVFTFDLKEEESLRHRWQLVRFDRRDDRTRPVTDYRTIDRALRGTLGWSTDIGDVQFGGYDGVRRWQKFNDQITSIGYEGYDNGPSIGWRRLLDEDEPAFIRKPLLTTVNTEVRMPPNITAAATPSTAIAAEPTDTPIDTRLRQLWSLGMNLPVLIDNTSPLAGDAITDAPQTGTIAGSPLNGTLYNRFLVPRDQMPPEWARALPVDLNMSALASADEADLRADFIRYAAAAFYLSLDELDQQLPNSDQDMKLQGIDLRGGGARMREYLAWQFAVNLYDYRDADARPTTIEWPTVPGVFISGVEKQPFFTEAYAWLRAGAGGGSGGPVLGPGSGASDKWFFAVELYMPPGWSMTQGEVDNLYLRSPGTSMGLVPIGEFRQIANDTALRADGLDGGPVDIGTVADADHGNYYVFVGNLDDEPMRFASDMPYRENGYFDNRFRIATDGRGRVELVWSRTGTEGDPTNIVLDVIGPNYSGGALASNSESGLDNWAKRPNGLAEGEEKQFSLRRSTKGWRFTTAWHAYTTDGPALGPGANPVTFDVSLGAPNIRTDQLTAVIPESVWPNLTSFTDANGRLANAFATVSNTEVGRNFEAFEAFDSVADLSRQFFIGPVDLDRSPLVETAFANLDFDARKVPTTAVLARILQEGSVTDLPNLPINRIVAGRLDFFNAPRIGGPNGRTWTWKIFDYFTTRSIAFDGLDNDGDGFTDLADPTESWDVTFRENGRVNLHTAPATVLRSGPSMSLLPTSAELVDQERRLGIADTDLSIRDPLTVFNASPADSWFDMASAIVALRENRDAPIRVFDPATGQLQVAATARVAANTGGPGLPGATIAPTTRRDGALAGPIELTRVRDGKIVDAVGNRNSMFDVTRYDRDLKLPLTYNTLPNGTNFEDNGNGAQRGGRFSPDYRYRGDLIDGVNAADVLTDFVPIQAAPAFTGNPAAVESDLNDGAGIRGRDIYMSRWTNVFGTRSDCFTAYIALIDEDGNYVRRAQLTLDRSVCFRERADQSGVRQQILPRILVRNESSYADDTR